MILVILLETNHIYSIFFSVCSHIQITENTESYVNEMNITYVSNVP